MILQPKFSRQDIEERIKPLNIDRAKFPLLIIGIRGYDGGLEYNKRNVFDDAIGVLTSEYYGLWKGNTDPSKRGTNPKIKKGYATLKPGFYPSYRFDTHNGSLPHEAICQRIAPVTVIRDGGKEEKGMLGINIHRGGQLSTSSEGCQTLPYGEWAEFYRAAKQEAQRLWAMKWKTETVGYCLLEV